MPNYRRNPKSFTNKRVVDISVLCNQFLDKNDLSDAIYFQKLSECFSEVVGELILPHVKIVSLEKKILVLKASSSVWKSELFLQKNAIIEKCNSLLGKPVIQSIRFI